MASKLCSKAGASVMTNELFRLDPFGRLLCWLECIFLGQGSVELLLQSLKLSKLWSWMKYTQTNRIEQNRTESSKTEIEDCTLRSAQTREPGNGIVALSQECCLSALSWITHSIRASIPPIIQHGAEKYMPLQSAVSWQSWDHGVHLLSCYSSGRGSPSSRNAYRLDTDTIARYWDLFLFFELTSGFTLQGATGFSCCTAQHVALCLALATRTNEANEARKASQSRSLRSKSLKKRPGARIHDKTMCHQLFQLLLQGKSMGC